MLLASLSLAGFAQDEPVAETYNYDRLLVATVQAEDRAWDADASRLYDAMVTRFTRTNEVVSMAEIPDFDVQGYDAVTYIVGCPPGQYPGCALVVAQRADVERAVGATVRREPDELDENSTVLVATFHILDVPNSREVVSFSVPVAEAEQDQVIEGLSALYDDIVRGDYELRDLRDRNDPNQSELDAERRKRMAEALDRLEQRLGDIEVADQSVIVSRPKLTKEDLAEYAQRDDVPPWEQLHMSQGEYIRFANSGQTYADWAWGGWGRTGRLLVRVGGGAGSGPFHQRYAAQTLLGTNLQPVDKAQLLEVTQGSSVVGDFEVGFGFLPWLEASVAAAVHTGRTVYANDEDVVDQVPLPTDDTIYPTSTWQFGGRVAVAPFPRWVARPVLGAGVASWRGAGISAAGWFDRMEAPNATFLELLPGVEVSASDDVVPWVRLATWIPLGGTLLREEPSAGTLTNAPIPIGDPGMGLAVQLGLQIRIGPFVKPKTNVRPGPTFEDP
ncbi:MAG: hypothetical protein H6735_14430 [Alphaproteobacteria bacterium]|nr:hypothetical protein [Alphaproteobacteria bacterium]